MIEFFTKDKIQFSIRPSRPRRRLPQSRPRNRDFKVLRSPKTQSKDHQPVKNQDNKKQPLYKLQMIIVFVFAFFGSIIQAMLLFPSTTVALAPCMVLKENKMKSRFVTAAVSIPSFFLQLILFCYTYIFWYFENIRSVKSDSVACLVGKTAIVTGGNSGIGYATSVLLASRGCRVIIACRSAAKKEAENIITQTGNPNIIVKYLNLCSFKSVRAFADDIKSTEKKIDILINNAGVMIMKDELSEDGLNAVMQTNYFGAFLLTHLLLDPLKASGSARVVFVSSGSCYLHRLSPKNLNPNDLDKKRRMVIKTYPNSKACNIIAAQEFAKRIKIYGIMVNSADPGVSGTPIISDALDYCKGDWFVKIYLEMLVKPVAHDIMEAAQTSFHLATSEKLKEETGQHYLRCRRFYKPYKLKNQKFIENIWMKTEELVKLTPEEKL